VGKPEIIGYLGADGTEITKSTHVRDGWVDEKHGILWSAGSIRGTDALLRGLGCKRVYKPREFHAKPAHGGYRILCKTCGTTTLTAGYLPHDSAKMHAEREHHHSTTWS